MKACEVSSRAMNHALIASTEISLRNLTAIPLEVCKTSQVLRSCYFGASMSQACGKVEVSSSNHS